MHSRNSRSKFHRIRTSNHREYQHYQAQTNNQIQMYQITSLNYYHLKEVEWIGLLVVEENGIYHVLIMLIKTNLFTSLTNKVMI